MEPGLVLNSLTRKIPWTHDPSVSASPVLGFQSCTHFMWHWGSSLGHLQAGQTLYNWTILPGLKSSQSLFIVVIIIVVTIVIIENQCDQPDVWSAGTRAPPISISPVLGLQVHAMTSTYFLSHLPRPYTSFYFSRTMSPFCCSLCWLGFLFLGFCFLFFNLTQARFIWEDKTSVNKISL